jgi:molecular chaperone IbpA
MRTTYDFAPLFSSSIGFEHLFNLLENAARVQQINNWPPYNIEKTGEESYRITMAVAGFNPDEIDVTAQPNLLVVSGQKHAQDNGTEVLYRGIAGRSFERRFELADYVEVAGAALQNGLLTVELVRQVPEAMKPKKIAIGTARALSQDNNVQQITEQKAA